MVSETLRLPLPAVVASSSAMRSSRSAQQLPPRSAAIAAGAKHDIATNDAQPKIARLDVKRPVIEHPGLSRHIVSTAMICNVEHIAISRRLPVQLHLAKRSHGVAPAHHHLVGRVGLASQGLDFAVGKNCCSPLILKSARACWPSIETSQSTNAWPSLALTLGCFSGFTSITP